MARIPRKELIDESEVGIYHCVNRCVRRAFLCGEDPHSGNNYDHRKEWIQRRLELLAGQFGIDLLGFAVMSNHVHLVVRNRPDVVQSWSDEEVARRWWNLFPGRRDKQGQPAPLEPEELQRLLTDGEKLGEWRRRLSSISWWMRCLCEKIARMANKEDECTGRFWEGRYKCQRLLDEAAVLACAMYVDLNPIRAGIAKTPETSQFTSAYQRIHARRPGQRGRRRPSGNRRRREPLLVTRDDWLSPVELNERRQRTLPAPQWRASNRGFLPLKLFQYLELLDWTGRQVRAEKRGATPAQMAPILQRLQVSSDRWIELVENFGRWFGRAVGRSSSLQAESHRRGRRWLHGVRHTRVVFT